jgi:2-oxoglutarate ferredoxin oxidoreductase subunit gamma
MMGDLKQICLCGFGGQGVILAGTILGYAAINDGKWVAGSNSYGAQARGGSARSEVVISKKPIMFPHVIQSDVLIALSQSAYDKYIKNLSGKDSLVVYDDQMVEPKDTKGSKQIAIPATKTAISELNSKQVANIVILGASGAISGIVSKQALILSITENVEERFRGLNLKAIEIGYNLGEDVWQSKEEPISQ